MKRKRIAVITARADESEQSLTLKGIAAAALSDSIDVVVFSNRYNYWNVDETLTYENVIYDLFSPEFFDGVILMTEPFMDINVIGSVISKINAACVPAVVIGDKTDSFPVVECNDDADMAKITEHLITVHGLSEFDVLTGPEDNPVSHKRVKGCVDECRRHRIELREECIIYGNFWVDAGYDLGMKYLSGERRLPQAVICTSDNMAYGLCTALSESPVRIPEDLTVTGYDRSTNKLLHYSLFTSCKRRRYDSGIRAVKMLFPDIRVSESEASEVITGDTCACGIDHERLANELRCASIQEHHMMGYFTSEFSTKLTLCRTLSEYMNVVHDLFHLLHNADSLRFILDGDDENFTGEEFLCCRISEGSAEMKNYSEKAMNVISGIMSESETARIYYLNPLCFQEKNFGYTMLEYNEPDCYDFSFRDFSKTAANALEMLRMKNDIHYLRQCRQLSALYDALTGFYTLHEFQKILGISKEQLPESSCLIAVNVRFAENSTYQHGECFRNDIIAKTAGVIKKAAGQEDICCRAEENTLIILRKNDENGLFYMKLRAMIHHELLTFRNESSFLVNCIQSPDKPESVTISKFCEDVIACTEHEYAELEKRRTLPHYKDFRQLHNRIHTNPHKTPDAETICRELCLSGGYFRMAYRKCEGVTYSQDCINARVALACYLLCTTVMSVYSIAIKTGYKNEKYFARQFRNATGFSPSQFREKCGEYSS